MVTIIIAISQALNYNVMDTDTTNAYSLDLTPYESFYVRADDQYGEWYNIKKCK